MWFCKYNRYRKLAIKSYLQINANKINSNQKIRFILNITFVSTAKILQQWALRQSSELRYLLTDLRRQIHLSNHNIKYTSVQLYKNIFIVLLKRIQYQLCNLLSNLPNQISICQVQYDGNYIICMQTARKSFYGKFLNISQVSVFMQISQVLCYLWHVVFVSISVKVLQNVIRVQYVGELCILEII
eukprot:TRINITY_DN1199_c1_g1_i2.p2 TRINITY_DN1199_c1_g1~~TRINITY_DN1199_c1_g1_i2.p2  ORF type:complete len:186 (+),score=-15.26 TRINITY_DN1199_c1_g1_i2:257-814(+)